MAPWRGRGVPCPHWPPTTPARPSSEPQPATPPAAVGCDKRGDDVLLPSSYLSGVDVDVTGDFFDLDGGV